MSAEQSKPKGIDLASGVSPDAVSDGGMISGHAGEDAVLGAPRRRILRNRGNLLTLRRPPGRGTDG